MKHTVLFTTRCLLPAAIFWAFPAWAADSVTVHWDDVCRTSHGHQLELETTNGNVVSGYCMSIGVDEIAITTKDQKVVKLARKSLSRIQMHRAKGSQLRSLGRGLHKTLADGVGLLFSPLAPAGIVLIPGTLAWGAVAAPFCLLGDLQAKLSGTQELKVI